MLESNLVRRSGVAVRRACPRTVSRLLMVAAAGLALAGCATAPSTLAPAASLLDDGLFRPPAEVIDAQAVFALSEPMQRFAEATRTSHRGQFDQRRALLDALTVRGQLRLDYDDGRTRNASEAFDKRAGNCLSLVLMTAAFAKHLELPVRFQSVLVRPLYSRGNDLTMVSGHVNVVLSPRYRASFRDQGIDDEMTVDFVPPTDLRGVSVRTLPERTVLAMYMNNRAAETLTAGEHHNAYAFAREALRQDPDYLPGINTLAVVYLRAGHLAAAEKTLRHVLAQAPEDEAALTNLVATLHKSGRYAEAERVAGELARVQPYPPFHFLDLGRQALSEGRVDEARTLIARELRRQPYQHEAHFWAAVVDAATGDVPRAEQHLRRAMEHSGNPQLQSRYSAKLAALRGIGAN
ncbi:MAG: hypothetical protein C0505_02720 [Leptothrix sp. (in: Bacteria)]|nr:hypothetical protein [Leptothrix sp. (in: b-proteobacteria)]